MQQGSHKKQLSQITRKNPTLIYDSGAAAKIQVAGSSFSKREGKFSKLY
jgi:hypothetical protein